MVCMYCGDDTQVVNSRLQRRSNQIWRRRKCRACRAVFSSLEAVDFTTSLSLATSQNIGSSGKVKTRLQPFSRDILFVSILDSCRHRKTAVGDATALTSTILGRILPLIHDGVIDRNDLIVIVAETLKRFDKAAHVYYAAYHPI